jgi:hypothetical protein
MAQPKLKTITHDISFFILVFSLATIIITYSTSLPLATDYFEKTIFVFFVCCSALAITALIARQFIVNKLFTNVLKYALIVLVLLSSVFAFIFATIFSAYVYVFASCLAGLFIYLSIIELMLAKKYVAENKDKEI